MFAISDEIQRLSHISADLKRGSWPELSDASVRLASYSHNGYDGFVTMVWR